MYMLYSFLLSLLLLLGGSVFCDELRISTADEFIKISNDVNSGMNYKGTTVILDSDIDFDGKTFEPIGISNMPTHIIEINTTSLFLGTIDGQGHTIRNLLMDSSSNYIGLIGFSRGTVVKNIVIDSSCSITSSFNSSNMFYIGSIIGYCTSLNNSCIIENAVNMGEVSFKENRSDNSLNIGGFVGSLSYSQYSTYEIILRNCANYGPVVQAGKSSYFYMSGIAAYVWGSTKTIIHFQNCLNYGTLSIKNTNSSGSIYIGGISASSRYTNIENSVSFGKFFLNNLTYMKYVGGITGYTNFNSHIINCYWDKDITETVCGIIGSYSTYIMKCSSFDSSTFELNDNVSVGTYTGNSLFAALNAGADHYLIRDYSHWVLNKNANTVSFTINGRTQPFTLSSQIILLPNLASEKNPLFDGWYMDGSYELPLESLEITEDRALYGKWEDDTNSYTISFDTRGGIPNEPITGKLGDVVTLPNNTERENCQFELWVDAYGDIVPWEFTVPAHNLTLRAVWSCTHINSAVDLVDFSKVINSWIRDFEGTTVYLDSDIVFTDEFLEQFDVIGDGNFYFCGTFDGQGHTISNLKIDSTPQYAGLFGYSHNLVVKNVVMDSSCSFTTSYNSTKEGYVGSFIAFFQGFEGSCIVENSVNMANLKFSGFVADRRNLFIGGIVGCISMMGKYEASIKNCANYGSITFSGYTIDAHVGGIAGEISMRSSQIGFIQNCLNYGSITFNGIVSSSFYIGGIIGFTSSTIIENSVSTGKITLTTPSKVTYEYVGGIAGYIYSSDEVISHCIWTSEVGYDNIANESLRFGVSNSSLITTLNTTTTDDLNEYAESNNTWSRWAMLELNGGNINGLGEETLVGGLLKSLPVPVKEGYTFLYWCTDEECNEEFYPESTEESSVSMLYAEWEINNYTVTFDFNNGTTLSIVLSFNEIIDYPEDLRMEGFSFNGWIPNPERIGARDISVRAQWEINNYTVTFNGNGGTPSKGFLIVTYNSTYGELPTASRNGHTFVGWFTEEVDGEEVTSETTFRIADNQTLYAQWSINRYTITLDFNNGTEISAILSFNESIDYPKDMKREGFEFIGWSPNLERMPAENLTIRAQWNITNPSEYIEIVFSKNDLNEEEVKKIIAKYTSDEFAIKKFEVDMNTGELKVTARFGDKEKASEFITSIDKKGDIQNSHIKNYGFIYDLNSFSSTLYLLPFIIIAVISV